MFKQLNTSGIPELRFLHDWMDGNEAQYQSILNQYTDVLRAIILIGEDNIEAMSTTKKLIKDNKLEYFNASNFEVITFFKRVAKNKSIFENIISDIFSDNTKVILNLQTLLENGSQIANNGSIQPRDGDSIWDDVIWGHTQLIRSASEIVMIHFLVSHYISQYINFKFGEIYGFKQKDDFLLVMTDILMYYKGDHEGIFKIWSLAKSEGGLGWINQKQLKYFSK